MLKTICLKNSCFEGYNLVVDLNLFCNLEHLYIHIRNRLAALFVLNNLVNLKEMADNMDMQADVFSSLEEMMLSNEKVIYIVCKNK